MNEQETARALAKFLKWAMQEGAWSGYELGGGDIQEKAEYLGLLSKEPYDPAKHAEFEVELEAGEEIFVLSDEVKALLK